MWQTVADSAFIKSIKWGETISVMGYDVHLLSFHAQIDKNELKIDKSNRNMTIIK
jgi:hypothetical protein